MTTELNHLQCAFDRWWENEGSGVSPQRGCDMEEHAMRMAWHAWQRAFEIGVNRNSKANRPERERHHGDEKDKGGGNVHRSNGN